MYLARYLLLASVLLAGFFPAAADPVPTQKRLVAYYYFGDQTETPKYTAAQIPYGKLTHLIHVAVQPVKSADGEIKISRNALEPELIPRAHKAGVKVLVCVQGAASIFSKIAADANARIRFGASLKAFVVKYGYDGVDIDWEVPEGRADVTNCTALMQALRDALPAPDYLLSMATPSTPGNWGEYDFKGLTPIVDFYNVMTYDFHGPWTPVTGHNSPLFSSDPERNGSLDESVDLYLNKFGVPPEKINLHGVLWLRVSGGRHFPGLEQGPEGREPELRPLHQGTGGPGRLGPPIRYHCDGAIPRPRGRPTGFHHL